MPGYECRYCNKTSQSPVFHYAHLYTHINHETIASYSQEELVLCQQNYNRRSETKKKSYRKNLRSKYECNLCEYNTTTNRCMKIHLINKHTYDELIELGFDDESIAELHECKEQYYKYMKESYDNRNSPSVEYTQEIKNRKGNKELLISATIQTNIHVPKQSIPVPELIPINIPVPALIPIQQVFPNGNNSSLPIPPLPISLIQLNNYHDVLPIQINPVNNTQTKPIALRKPTVQLYTQLVNHNSNSSLLPSGLMQPALHMGNSQFNTKPSLLPPVKFINN